MYSKSLIFAALTLAVHVRRGQAEAAVAGDSGSDPTLAAQISSLLAEAGPEASSYYASITSVIPTSVIGALMTDPAAVASDLMGSTKPAWFQALPTDVKSYFDDSFAPLSSVSEYYSGAIMPTHTADAEDISSSMNMTGSTMASPTSLTSTRSGSSSSGSSTSAGSSQSGSTGTSQTSRSTSAATGSSSGASSSSASSSRPATVTSNPGSKPTGAIAAGVAGIVGMLGVAAIL